MTDERDDAMITIWGAGAIGGTIGAHLVRAGREVVFVDVVREHVERMREDGLRVTGPVAEFRVPVRAALPDELDGLSGPVFLCVKAMHTAGATRAIEPLLPADGVIVSAQNGLNEAVIASIVGEARTLGCFVNFGADYLEPGVIHYGGRGAVVVGEIDGRVTERARSIHEVLRVFEDRAVLTTNIHGFLWSKLAYASMLFATALSEQSIADALDRADHRRIYIELAREVVRVALARGIRLESFDGFDPAAFREDASDEAAHLSLDALVTHNRTSAKTHSGIWRDLAVRKRKTEVDAQLGPVVEAGRELDIGTPLNARLVELIHEIENGRRQQAAANVAAIAG
jgi:2-dehydropantoate 2-reductase